MVLDGVDVSPKCIAFGREVYSPFRVFSSVGSCLGWFFSHMNSVLLVLLHKYSSTEIKLKLNESV